MATEWLRSGIGWAPMRRFVIMGRGGICVLELLACLLVPAVLTPQEPSHKNSEPSKAQASKPDQKPALAEVTRVSTDEAAHSAARKKAEGNAGSETSDQPADSAVTEFHPAARTSGASSEADAGPSKGPKRSLTKNLHGTVYGARGTGHDGDHKAGASVGASSKSGKTNIYVETNRSRESSPAPR